jgi:two-component system sensor histidine kinase UhpB
MESILGIIGKLRQLLPSLSICARIAIGNALIIAAGALAGTAVTRTLTEKGDELVYLSLIVAGGVVVSIVVNTLIIRSALSPLNQARQYAEQVFNAKPSNNPPILRNPDPDTCQLTGAIHGLASQLDANQNQLRVISRRAINAHEEERKRIAGWLHDDTGQALVSMILKLERLEQKFPEQASEQRQLLADTRQLAAHALDNLRKEIAGLRPSILDDLGLAPAIRWYARSRLEEAGVRVDFQAPEEPLKLPAEISVTLFRAAQEAINNITRHAQASQAKIVLKEMDGEVYLRVEDDGQGFILPSEPDAPNRQHWGLLGLRERVSLAGGWLNLVSEPGQGVLIEIHLPLLAQDEDADG